MQRKNYSKFSDRFKKTENEEVVNEIKETIENEVKQEETVEVVEEVKTETYIKTGEVVGCEKLNVREQPYSNAKVLCVLNKGDKVQVDLKIDGEPEIADASFYQICTAAGVKGHCMTKFISIK